MSVSLHATGISWHSVGDVYDRWNTALGQLSLQADVYRWLLSDPSQHDSEWTIMIVDANGRRVKQKTTDAPFSPRLFEMLAALSDTLSQQGVVLMCVRCGTPIQGRNHPFDAIYYLECQCARRTFDKTKAMQSAQLRTGRPTQ